MRRVIVPLAAVVLVASLVDIGVRAANRYPHESEEVALDLCTLHLQAWGDQWSGKAPPDLRPIPDVGQSFRVDGVLTRTGDSSAVFTRRGRSIPFRKVSGGWWSDSLGCGSGGTLRPGPVTTVLAVAAQPPDPCRLLTTDDLRTAIQGDTDPVQSPFTGKGVDPHQPPLAAADHPYRGCAWRVGGALTDVSIVIWTQAAEDAAVKAQQQAWLGPDQPSFPSLAVLFSKGPFVVWGPGYPTTTLLGYPARSGSGAIEVLTPTLLLTIYTSGPAVPNDGPTLIRLATIALGRVGSTGPQ